LAVAVRLAAATPGRVRYGLVQYGWSGLAGQVGSVAVWFSAAALGRRGLVRQVQVRFGTVRFGSAVVVRLGSVLRG